MMKSIQEPFVSYLSEKSRKKAETFSKKHDLFLQTPREVRKFHNDKLIIWIDQEDTYLQDLSIKNSKPFSLKFTKHQSRNNNKNLLQRCFSKFDTSFLVYDLTAGFCLDSFLISELGFKVKAYEKESWLYEFTKEKLKDQKIFNIKIKNKNSLDVMGEIENKSIIYLDPMFGVDNKAFAKKEMHFLRKSLNDDPDKLINAALESKACLIVVKRHKVDKFKIKNSPSFELQGKVVSFQVYDRRKRL